MALLKAASAAQEGTQKTSIEQLPTYFPNTEELRPDEMRITALGTGLLTPITRAQKSTAWVVELDNGDVFLFDLGSTGDNRFVDKQLSASVRPSLVSPIV